jgi:hypothetical protein
MKKPKFVYVPQRTDFDCGIASLAMITGHTYDDVAKRFATPDDGSVFSMDLESCQKYLKTSGVTFATLRAHHFTNALQNRLLMSRPFADLHLVSAQRVVNRTYGHAFLMDKQGRFIDPDYEETPLLPKSRIHHFYWVHYVIGVWYDDK